MPMNGTITIVSNKGTGSVRKANVARDMTLSEILHAELGAEIDPAEHRIMLNGAMISEPKKTTIKDGDLVVIVPVKVKGN